jgi:hypothetical protein
MFATAITIVARKSTLERATGIELAFSAWEARLGRDERERSTRLFDSIAVTRDAESATTDCETFVAKDIERLAVPGSLLRSIRPRDDSRGSRKPCGQPGRALGIERRELDCAQSGACRAPGVPVDGDDKNTTSAVDNLGAQIRVAFDGDRRQSTFGPDGHTARRQEPPHAVVGGKARFVPTLTAR